MPSSLHRPRRFAPIPLILLALAAGSAASAQPLPCSNATLKGTYLYSESGREVYDGRGGTRRPAHRSLRLGGAGGALRGQAW